MKLNDILLQQNLLSYWDIMVVILVFFVLTPFIYIGYLTRRKVSEKMILYHYEGEYDANRANDLISYIEKLEAFFGKKFSDFKNLLLLFEKDPTEDKRMHTEIIESIIFCIKLNGRKRWNVFWNLADSVLKVMILMLPITGAIIVILSEIYFDFTGLVFSLIATILSLPIILIILLAFLKMSEQILRKRGISLPALSLAYFALDALMNSNVSRTYDKKTNSYYYYTTMHKYNNLVNSEFGFSNNYIRSSSSLLSNLKELALGDK